MTKLQNLLKGLMKENPVFVLVLGTCPTLAISTSVTAAFGMGIAATAVLILSNMAISALRKVIPDRVRIPCYIVLIAGFVTVVELIMEAYAYSLYQSLGVYLSLIVVNCIILGRAEAYACSHNIVDSAKDGLMMGLSYTFSLIAISLVRQILGTGVITLSNPFAGNAVVFSIQVLPKTFLIPFMTAETGSFFTFGVLAAAVSGYKNKLEEEEKAIEKAQKAAAAKAKAEAARKEVA